ncbi:hypothetical protein F0Q45_24855 [Mycobacterium simiae]|uniref:Uncharacterized protein n=1 Tax=Mycobacterium simiae TaxID=1784 RepID=A0A5B1B7U5_MYCSI|nr:hypothetical protein [Mycobacterium simiae]KAA1244558.1 hypothetical protein F0Q45_24855 [Mycobacterium simiae]
MSDALRRWNDAHPGEAVLDGQVLTQPWPATNGSAGVCDSQAALRGSSSPTALQCRMSTARRLVSRLMQLQNPNCLVDRVTPRMPLPLQLLRTIMFHPTVQPDEFRETARLLRATRYPQSRKFVGRIVPYPGTSLYQTYSDAGWSCG